MTIGQSSGRADASRGQQPLNNWICPLCQLVVVGDTAQRDHLSQCMARRAMRNRDVMQELAAYYTDLYRRNNPNYDRDTRGSRWKSIPSGCIPSGLRHFGLFITFIFFFFVTLVPHLNKNTQAISFHWHLTLRCQHGFTGQREGIFIKQIFCFSSYLSGFLLNFLFCRFSIATLQACHHFLPLYPGFCLDCCTYYYYLLRRSQYLFVFLILVNSNKLQWYWRLKIRVNMFWWGLKAETRRCFTHHASFKLTSRLYIFSLLTNCCFYTLAWSALDWIINLGAFHSILRWFMIHLCQGGPMTTAK